jgi:hypothetical protein
VGTNIAERTPGGPPGASVCVTDVPDAAQAFTRTR